MAAQWRQRVHAVGNYDLSRICEGLLGDLPHSQRLIFIRRIRIDLSVSDDAIHSQNWIRRWAKLLTQGIEEGVRGADRHAVVFESARHYVQSYLQALTRGRERHQWFYRRFENLDYLAPEIAALELLTSREDWTADQLIELRDSDCLEWYIRRWNLRQLNRVLTIIGDSLTEYAPRRVLRVLRRPTVRARLKRYAEDLSSPPDHPRYGASLSLHTTIALIAEENLSLSIARLLATLWSAHRVASPSTNSSTDDNLLSVENLSRRLQRAGQSRIASWLTTSGDRASIVAIANELAELASLEPTRSDIDGTGPKNSRPHNESSASNLYSPVGGCFLLLHPLMQLQVWNRLLDVLEERDARRCLFVIALMATGADRAALRLSDLVLTRFAGLERPPVANARASEENPISHQWFEPEWIEEDIDETFLLSPRVGFPWLSAKLNRALAAVTTQALRQLAVELEGFENSSPAFVAHRFVAQPSHLDFGPHTIIARLHGGPLRLVLKHSDLLRALTPPWLDEPVILELKNSSL